MSTESSPKLGTVSDGRPKCPVGKDDCAIIDEVLGLRQVLQDLAEQAQTDPLTGLYNYRFFSTSLAQEIERTGRSGQPTTLLMLDIDHFKRVNDSWGHEVGNQALVHIAGLIRETLRRLDIPCRYGGEEFAVILPDTSLATAVSVAERLRARIEETPLAVADKKLQLSVSVGAASYLLGGETSPEQLVKRADHYLYQAKQDGRNCVRHATIEPVEIVSRAEKDSLFALFGRRGQDDQEKTE